MDHGAERPSARFAGETELIDIGAHAAELLARADGSKHGHAQRTLYRYGPASAVMFALRAGGTLPRHELNAVVTVQVIEGEATLTTADGPILVRPGSLLRMEPGVGHDVRADGPAILLVHILMIASG